MRPRRLDCRFRSQALPSIFALACACAHADAPATADADAAFGKLADEYFDTLYLPANPSTATELGIHRFDDRIEDRSRAGTARTIAALERFEKRVEAVDASRLSVPIQGDRDLVLDNIRSTLLTLRTIRPWEKNPDTYSSGISNDAFVLMERKFAPAAERLRSLIAREKQMPAALAAARANLKHPPRIYTEIALEQIGDLVDFFRKDVPSAFSDVTDAAMRKEFATTNAAVVKALEDYAAWMKSDLLPRSNGEFRIGAATFREKLRDDEQVDTPLDELVALDLADMRRNKDEFARVAKSLDPDKTPEQVLAELASDHPDPGKLLDSFRATFDGLVKFINDNGIVTIPSTVRPTLEETPPFMRATTFASMDTPGPFESAASEAYFNVTLPDPSWPKTRIDEFMAQFSYPVISNVVVHEAYPGHYIQFLWMHDVHDRVRKILGASTNVEGWAHYCEQMMLDEGLAQALFPNDARQQKLLKLGQLQDALLRNARFYVGIELHTGKITFDQAIDFFVKQGYQSHEVGVVETKRGTSDPTYLYYTLGKLEIMKLRDDVKAKEGAAFDLKRFHDRFLRQGSPPIPIVRRAMLGETSTKAS